MVSKKKAENLLQLIIPESPKDIELNQRLSKEISDEQRNKLHSWQIEKLENNIRNEIELKYDTFDINDLSKVNDNDINCRKNKYKYQWSTNIEMLEFDVFWFRANNEILELLKDKLTCQRIKSAYKNLRGLIIDDVENNFGVFTCQMMLNTVACQLESLHFNCHSDYIGMIDKWHFVSNDYPCVKDRMNSSWFPKNLKHLCLSNYDDTWGKILTNCTKLTKLKHLKIGSCVGYEDGLYRDGMDNITSFVNNGLESLHFRFDHVHAEHVFTNRDDRLLNKICAIFKSGNNNNNNNNNNDAKLANNFILKLEFEIPQLYTNQETALMPYDENYLIDDLNSLYSSLCVCFRNAMFAFKIIVCSDLIYMVIRQFEEMF